MGAQNAVSLLVDLLGAAQSLMAQANSISLLISKAQAEGRAISPEEWKAIDGAQIEARAKAIAAVAAL